MPETFLIMTTLTHSHQYHPLPPTGARNRLQDPHPFNHLWCHQFWQSRTTLNFVCLLVQSEGVFQTIPEWAQFSQGGQRKRRKKKHGKLARKFPWKSCSNTFQTLFSTNPGKILKPFQNLFQPKWSLLINDQQKTKNNEARKVKQEGSQGEKAKEKSQDFCVIFKPKNYLGIFFSKLIFCTWIRRPQSVRALHSQTEKNVSTGFKTSFLAKFWGVNSKNLSKMVP